MRLADAAITSTKCKCEHISLKEEHKMALKVFLIERDR